MVGAVGIELNSRAACTTTIHSNFVTIFAEPRSSFLARKRDKHNRQYGSIGKTAPMPIGICKLCLLTKDLKDSHLMPRSLYKRSRGSDKKGNQG